MFNVLLNNFDVVFFLSKTFRHFFGIAPIEIHLGLVFCKHRIAAHIV